MSNHEAPERIWAYAVSDGVVTDYNWTDTPNSGTEYIRADIAASQLAGIHELYGFEQRGRLAAEAERDRLAADNARLREALEPFGKRCDEVVRPDDSDNDGVTIKTRYLRAARAAGKE